MCEPIIVHICHTQHSIFSLPTLLSCWEHAVKVKYAKIRIHYSMYKWQQMLQSLQLKHVTESCRLQSTSRHRPASVAGSS